MATLEGWTDANGNAHWIDMDLGESKDYFIDWAARMLNEGDTLTSVVWDVPTGLTQTKQSEIDDIFYVWLTADAVGNYEVKATITAIEQGVTNTYVRIMHLAVV